VKILKTFNEMYGLFFKWVQNVRTENIFNPTLLRVFIYFFANSKKNCNFVVVKII